MNYKKIYFALFFTSFIWSLTICAQEKIGPWKVIPQCEVPDSILDLAHIQFDIESIYQNLGRETRHVYFLKTQFDSISGEMINGALHTTLELPREPDSTEIVAIVINEDETTPFYRTIRFKAPAYSDSDTRIIISKDTLGTFTKFTCTIAKTPTTYNAYSFTKSTEYGYFLQYISTYHPEIVGIDDLAINDQINLYPNPADNQILLDIDPELDVGCNSIAIYDLLGQEMKDIGIADCMAINRIDVSEFSSGKYWLLIRDNNDRLIARKQFVKL